MSDTWEKLYHNGQLLPPSFLPQDDADGDGVSNFRESVAATDPFNGVPPDGFFQTKVSHIPAVRLSTGGGEPEIISPEAFIISWKVQAGKGYNLQSSSDLTPDGWIPVVDLQQNNDGEATIGVIAEDLGGTLPAKLFWRVAASDTDEDGDGFTSWEENKKGSDPLVPDHDEDGLPDDWELANNLDSNDDGGGDLANGPEGDPDGDGLVNLQEWIHHGDPHYGDTDLDGLGDALEALTHHTLVDGGDTDSDALDDYQEVMVYGSNPLKPDEDRDSLDDYEECVLFGTDPKNADTDSDTMNDDWELDHGFDPLVPNPIMDPDNDGLGTSVEHLLHLDPLDNDTDDDGTLDGDEDYDKDTLSNRAEVETHHTNPKSPDTDMDSLPDGWEITYSLNPRSAASPNGSEDDPDDDELSNFEEWRNHTNPHLPDSDGDGVEDGVEVSQGSDPSNPGDGGEKPKDGEIIEVPFVIHDPSSSTSEKWEMKVTGMGPDDFQNVSFATKTFGGVGSGNMKLRKWNRYEVRITHLDTDPDFKETNDDKADYDWEATVDSKPAGVSSPQTEENPGSRNFFMVKDHWLVDNRQAVFTKLNGGDDIDLVTGKVAYLVPVAIKDNSEATGVDDISITATPAAVGYQSKFWIMAPAGGTTTVNGAPVELSDDMHFKIPLNPPVDLEITSDKATVTPTSPAVTSLGTTTPGPIVNWKGNGSETSDNVTTYKIGKGKEEIDLPVRVKTMKKRTVRVGVYPLSQYAALHTVPVPDHAQLVYYLNQVYGYQVNAWMDVTIMDQINNVQFDTLTTLVPGEGGSEREDAIVGDIEARSEAQDFDIIVILIADVDYLYHADVDGDGHPDAISVNGHTITQKSCIVCPRQKNFPELTSQQVMDTIAHEMSHIMIRELKHPDPKDNAGPAPLDEDMNHSRRIACSGSHRASDAKLLLKAEWDEIEAWLKLRPNGDN